MNKTRLFNAGDTIITETFEVPLLIEDVEYINGDVWYVLENKVVGRVRNEDILIDKTLEHNNADCIVRDRRSHEVFLAINHQRKYELIGGGILGKAVAERLYPTKEEKVKEAKEDVAENATTELSEEQKQEIADTAAEMFNTFVELADQNADAELLDCYRKVLKDLINI